MVYFNVGYPCYSNSISIGYNGRFSKQYFRSEIEDANQNITFCGVGSHHQNENFKRKIQTITLGARKLLLHTKIYWPEAITIMLCPHALKAFA